jgi:hypothetical protein
MSDGALSIVLGIALAAATGFRGLSSPYGTSCRNSADCSAFMAGDTFASSGFSESAPQQNTIARYSADSLCNGSAYFVMQS